MAVRITSKGQVTIPKEVREGLGIRPGDQVEFFRVDGAFAIRRHIDQAAYRKALDKWVGYLSHLKGRKSDDLVREMRDPWP